MCLEPCSLESRIIVSSCALLHASRDPGTKAAACRRASPKSASRLYFEILDIPTVIATYPTQRNGALLKKACSGSSQVSCLTVGS
jgi:hypothetical protein